MQFGLRPFALSGHSSGSLRCVFSAKWACAAPHQMPGSQFMSGAFRPSCRLSYAELSQGVSFSTTMTALTRGSRWALDSRLLARPGTVDMRIDSFQGVEPAAHGRGWVQLDVRTSLPSYRFALDNWCSPLKAHDLQPHGTNASPVLSRNGQVACVAPGQQDCRAFKLDSWERRRHGGLRPC